MAVGADRRCSLHSLFAALVWRRRRRHTVADADAGSGIYTGAVVAGEGGVAGVGAGAGTATSQCVFSSVFESV